MNNGAVTAHKVDARASYTKVATRGGKWS